MVREVCLDQEEHEQQESTRWAEGNQRNQVEQGPDVWVAIQL